jgi:hypothetical protein|tara:strand:- start:773 stop:1624 length:852 start_codon:yes stop_codon:yes gene_type:complete
MKRILIVGDSNGLGEWGTITPGPGCASLRDNTIFRPFNQDQYLEIKYPKPFQLVWPGFGYSLEKLFGHAVANYSFGGAGNFEAIFRAEEALGLAPPFTSPVFYNPDVIIWMLTEPARNYTRIKDKRETAVEAGLVDLEKHFQTSYKAGIDYTKTIRELDRTLMQVAFEGAQRVYDETNIPWIVIEGWGRTWGMENDYSFIKHVHKDWLKKILGRDIPLITSWEAINNISSLRSDLAETEEFKKIVNDYEEIVNYMKESDDFPDNAHPGRILHEQLAKELEPYV